MDKTIIIRKNGIKTAINVLSLTAVWFLRSVFTFPKELTGIFLEDKEETGTVFSLRIIFLILSLMIAAAASFILISMAKKKNPLHTFLGILLYASPLLFQSTNSIISAFVFLLLESLLLLQINGLASHWNGLLFSAFFSAATAFLLSFHSFGFLSVLFILFFINSKKERRISGGIVTTLFFLLGCAGNLIFRRVWPDLPLFSDPELILTPLALAEVSYYSKTTGVITAIAGGLCLVLTNRHFEILEKTPRIKGKAKRKPQKKFQFQRIAILFFITFGTIESIVSRAFFSPFAILALYEYSASVQNNRDSEHLDMLFEKSRFSGYDLLFLLVLLCEMILSCCGLNSRLFSAVSVTFV